MTQPDAVGGLAETCHQMLFIHDVFRMYHKWAMSSAFWPEPTYVPTINIPSRNLGLTNRSNQLADCLGKSKTLEITEHNIEVRHEHDYRPAYEASKLIYLSVISQSLSLTTCMGLSYTFDKKFLPTLPALVHICVAEPFARHRGTVQNNSLPPSTLAPGR